MVALRKHSLKQLTSFKTFALLLILCMLSVVVGSTKRSCTAKCSAQFRHHGSLTMAKSTSVGLLRYCCSNFSTTPCPHILESATAIEAYAPSVASAELNHAMGKIPAVVGGSLFISLSSHHATASNEPPIRGPSVPLFLQNLSLLI